MKLALGTAQFGLSYGISNTKGQVSEQEVHSILKTAQELGIHNLDTACSYGNSEEILGKVFLNLPKTFQLTTKTPHFKSEVISAQQVKELLVAFEQSLKYLQVEQVQSFLIHNTDALLKRGGELLFGAMQKLKADGKIQQIGCSVYYPAQLDQVLYHYNIDAVQLPLNIFDQRFLVSGHLRKLKQHDIKIQIRSVFLQGLLLMSPEALIPVRLRVSENLKKFRQHCTDSGRSPVEVALGFVASHSQVDQIIVGVTNARELKEIHEAYLRSHENINTDWLPFTIQDENIIIPSNWKKY